MKWLNDSSGKSWGEFAGACGVEIGLFLTCLWLTLYVEVVYTDIGLLEEGQDLSYKFETCEESSLLPACNNKHMPPCFL